MAVRGRRPKPTKMLILEGTFDNHRHKNRRREPVAPGDLTDNQAPKWMNKSQRELWTHAIQNAPIGVLKCIDREVLSVWVAAADRHQRAIEAQHMLDMEPDALPGMRYDKHHGKYSMCPLIRVIEHSATLMLKAGEALGFSPTARPRLVAPLSSDVYDNSPTEEIGSARSFQALISNRPKQEILDAE